MLLGALTAPVLVCRATCDAYMAANTITPASNVSWWLLRLPAKVSFLHPLTRGTYPRRDPQRSGHTDESIQKEKAEYDAMGKERTKKGGSTNAP